MIKPVTSPDPLFFMLVLGRGSSSWDEMGLYCDNVKTRTGKLYSHSISYSWSSLKLPDIYSSTSEHNKALYQNVFSFTASGLF